MTKLTTALALTALTASAVLALADDAKKVKPYPLKTCIVSGEKLGDGGMTPYVFTNDTQIIKLCCSNCLKDFKKDPAKYMKKLAEAEKASAAKDAAKKE
jgi:predicted lipoprotein with Yx(FWY)xxD motif